jgi:hypothetical protein
MLASTGLVIAAAIGVAAGAGALFLLARVDRDEVPRMAQFDIVDLPVPVREGNVLLLEERLEPEALLLDDPLEPKGSLPEEPFIPEAWLVEDPVPAPDESRVVRLFGTSPHGTVDMDANLGPGEMLARIDDFLAVPHRAAAAVGPGQSGNGASPDASDVLHAALADLRRSISQG